MAGAEMTGLEKVYMGSSLLLERVLYPDLKYSRS